LHQLMFITVLFPKAMENYVCTIMYNFRRFPNTIFTTLYKEETWMNLFLKARFILPLCLCCILLSGCAEEYERYAKKTDESDYGSTYAKKEQQGKMSTYGTTHADDKQHVNTTISYNHE